MHLTVTGLGMVTSVGYGRTGSCAAIRAGLTRACELPGVLVSSGDGDIVPARGHPITGFAEGFFQQGAWVRLAAGALEDLLNEATNSPSAHERWEQTALIALVPMLDPKRFMWGIHQQPDALTEHFLEPLQHLLKLALPLTRMEAVTSGHASFAEGLQRAATLLGSHREVSRVVLVGADSYLDGLTLQWLAQHRRLKSAEAPTGLLPGQAGACVVVEAAHPRDTNGGCHIVSVAVKSPPASDVSSLAKRGRLLAEAIQEVLAADDAGLPFRGELVLDLNGEEWKAHVWGNAQVLLGQQLDFDACSVLAPSESIGEVGAASGVVGTGLAVNGLMSPDSTHERALVCGIADSGKVSAILVRGPKRAARAMSRS
ncbi:hypothetical protein ACN469_40490 [Corallococcus terminator]